MFQKNIKTKKIYCTGSQFIGYIYFFYSCPAYYFNMEKEQVGKGGKN